MKVLCKAGFKTLNKSGIKSGDIEEVKGSEKKFYLFTSRNYQETLSAKKTKAFMEEVDKVDKSDNVAKVDKVNQHKSKEGRK